jgi:glycosyltransferase involved in cell wall biosynthesis
MTVVAHVMFGGLGGHSTVVFGIVDGGSGELEHRVAVVGREPPIPAVVRGCEGRRLPWSSHRTRGRFDWRFHRSVYTWLVRQRPDAIAVHSTGSLPVALAAARRTRSRVVVVEHQSWPLRSRRHDLATFLALLLADEVVVLSEPYAASLRRRHPRLTRRRPPQVIANGVDTTAFRPAAGARTAPERPWRVGMQSRLIPIKDHATLLRAVAIVERDRPGTIRLSIAGDGPSRPDLEGLISTLALSDAAHLEGMLDQGALQEWLRELDVYVHASLGEAMSTSILQALASGLPTIASDVDGIGDLLGGLDVAVLVPARDADALAEALAAIVDDADGAAAMARRGRDLAVARFDQSVMAAAYEQLLRADTLQDRAIHQLLERSLAPGDRVLVWPTRSPRIAYADRRVGRYLQRAGILGGGRTDWSRWALRRRVTWPLVRLRARRWRHR